MSEMCLDCLNKVLDTKESPKKFIISRKPALCEECGRYKRVVVRYKMRYIVADRWAEIVENVRNRQKS